MKVLRAKIEVEHPDATSTKYVGYPQVWLDNKELIQGVMDDDRPDELQENGKFFKILYAILPDDLYETLIAAHPDTFSAPDMAEVHVKAAKNWPKKKIWTDENAVKEVLVKNALGEKLTEADIAVINASDPTPGVVMSKDFFDICNDYGVDNIK